MKNCSLFQDDLKAYMRRRAVAAPPRSCPPPPDALRVLPKGNRSHDTSDRRPAGVRTQRHAFVGLREKLLESPLATCDLMGEP